MKIGENLRLHFSKGNFKAADIFLKMISQGMEDFDVPCDIYVRGDDLLPLEEHLKVKECGCNPVLLSMQVEDRSNEETYRNIRRRVGKETSLLLLGNWFNDTQWLREVHLG